MGGKCFNNVSRINKEDISATISEVEKVTSLALLGFELGSVGKKPTSGDIDLAIGTDIDVALLQSKLEQSLGSGNVRKIGKLLTCSFPVANKDSRVQVDFLQGDVKWLKILYHSGNNSKYSGAHRNGAIRAILRATKIDSKFDGDVEIERTKYMWSPVQEMCLVTQSRKKVAGRWCKNWNTNVINRVMHDSIPHIIFSNANATLDDINSLETIVDAINKYYNAADDIMKEIAIEFMSMKFDTEYVYPDCIAQHIGIV